MQNCPIERSTALTGTIFVTFSVFMSRAHFRQLSRVPPPSVRTRGGGDAPRRSCTPPEGKGLHRHLWKGPFVLGPRSLCTVVRDLWVRRPPPLREGGCFSGPVWFAGPVRFARFAGSRGSPVHAVRFMRFGSCGSASGDQIVPMHKNRGCHENSPCESCGPLDRTILHRISVRTFL